MVLTIFPNVFIIMLARLFAASTALPYPHLYVWFPQKTASMETPFLPNDFAVSSKAVWSLLLKPTSCAAAFEEY